MSVSTIHLYPSIDYFENLEEFEHFTLEDSVKENKEDSIDENERIETEEIDFDVNKIQHRRRSFHSSIFSFDSEASGDSDDDTQDENTEEFSITYNSREFLPIENIFEKNNSKKHYLFSKFEGEEEDYVHFDECN